MPLDPNAPFVLASNRRRLWTHLVLGVGVAALGVVLTMSYPQPVFVICAVVGVASVAVTLWALSKREPKLSADGEGLALQAFAGPDGVRSYRWEEIEAVFIHRLSRQFRMLCIRPRNLDAVRESAGDNVGTIDKAVAGIGAPYSVNLVAAGLSDEEALQRLQALAGQRVAVGERPSG